MKDALESIPCEVYNMDDLKVPVTGKHDAINVLTRDNVHEWARENGGPIEITDKMVTAGCFALADEGATVVDIFPNVDVKGVVRAIYAAMEAKRREGEQSGAR